MSAVAAAPRAVTRGPFAGLPREVPVLCAVAVLVALGFGVVAPALPVFARQFGVGEAAAGAVVSVFAFLRLAFALVSGRLVDRLGERVVLGTGIGLVAVSSALAGLAQSYVQLILLRGAGGIGSAMFTVSSLSLLLRVVPAAVRGRATGLYQGGFILGGITGPAFGGPLTQASIRAPFFVYAGTLAAAGTVAFVFLGRGPHTRGPRDADLSDAPQRTSLPAALRHRNYLVALASNLGTGWVAFGIRSSLIPLFVVEGLHRGAGLTGAGFAVSSACEAALLVPGGRLTDRAGRRPTLVLGLALGTASAALLAICHGPVLFLASMALLGAGFALVGPASGALVGDVVKGSGGTVVAAYQMAGDVGSITGPIVAGALAQTVSYGTAFGAGAGVLAVSTALATTVQPGARGGSRPPEPATPP